MMHKNVLGEMQMLKRVKAAIVLLFTLALVMQGVGIPAAQAETINQLTVDYLFDGLGSALYYGIVAEDFYQRNHAETSVFVDRLFKYHPDPFLNTETTYMYGQAYPLYATVSAPEGESLQGMEFALFQANGSALTMCDETIFKVTEDTNVTAVGWKLDEDSPYLRENLFIRQVEKDGAGNYVVVNEGAQNQAQLTVSYGPSVSSAAPSSSYIGYVQSDQRNDSINFYNAKEHNPPIEFGPDARLVVITGMEWVGPNFWDYKNVYSDVTDGTFAYGYQDFWGNWVNTAEVYLEYVDDNGQKVYSKFDGIHYEYANNQGRFYVGEGDNKQYMTITSTNENDKAAKLLEKARAFSEELGNIGQGGVDKWSLSNPGKDSLSSKAEPSILGNSTVTGPEDENGNVVSLYTVKATGGNFDQWALKDAIGQQKVLIAPNEYIVFNVVCESKDGTVYVHPGAEDMYIYEAGKADQALWGQEDSGASDRVLFNFVYLDETTGRYKPFEGTVSPSNSHGGTLLCPSAHITADRNPPNGAMIAKTVTNNGKEIHQRTMTAPAQTSWVDMVGRSVSQFGTVKLVKKNGSTLENLKDAEFGLYTDKACTQAVGKPVKTDKDGVAMFNRLTPGTYYVKETKAPAGYTLSDKVYTVQVKANVTSLVGTKGYVENFKGRGTLQIVKAEEGNTSVRLAGARFEIYVQTGPGHTFDAKKATLVGTYTTNRNGQITQRLDAGDYWIKEAEAPFGYEANSEPVRITIKPDETTTLGQNGIVTNKKMPTGTLEVSKVDADDPTITLWDAEFTLYLDAECSEKVLSFTTGTQGMANVTLPIGTYWVKETKAPSNYILDDTVHRVEIKANQSTKMGQNGMVSNEHVKGTIWVKKIEEVWNEGYWSYGYWQAGYWSEGGPLAGAEFTVYSDYACTNRVATMVTGTDGIASARLKPGKYWVKETRAPIGYEIQQTNAIEVEFWQSSDNKQVWDTSGRNGAVVNRRTTNSTGAVQLYKAYVDENGTTIGLNGAKFQIFRDAACTDPLSAQVFETRSVGQHVGRLDIEGLAPGSYWLKEVEAPAGFALLEEALPFTITAGETYRIYGPNGETFIENKQVKTDYTSVTVKKIWVDNDNQDGLRPQKITVRLLADGAPVAGQTAELSGATNEWTHTFTNLPAKNAAGSAIKYTVEEVGTVAGYTTASSSDGLTLTNTHTAEETEITVTKLWVDSSNQDGKRPSEIKVQLYANGVVKGEPVTVTGTGDTWSYTFTKLPKYEQGAAIKYTVAEVSVPEYTATYSDDTLTITNTHETANTSVSVEKKWVDDNDQDGIRPDSITVQLLADGTALGEPVTLNAANNWKHTWPNLEKMDNGAAIVYTVQETAVTGYTGVITGDAATGFIITNTHETANTSVSVEKKWVDDNDQDGIRPDSITVQLLADGTALGEPVTLNAANNWKHTWSNLEKMNNGAAIVYTVQETAVTGYTGVITGDAATGFIITNTHEVTVVEEKVKISGTKTWEDKSNVLGKRPASITVNLLADGVKVDSCTVSGTGDVWHYEFTDLPKYTAADGVKTEIVYTVTEEPVDGYESAVNGFDLTNRVTNEIVGTLEIRASKQLTGNVRRVQSGLFRFAVYLDDKKVADGWNTAEGGIAFDEIKYTFDDIGETYIYSIREVIGAPMDDQYIFDYDNTIYTVRVTIGVDANGQMVVEKEYFTGKTRAASVDFRNQVDYREGALALKKVNGDNTALGLAGAEFSVYSDASCKEFVGRIITDEKGEGTLDKLPVGRYYIKETKAPAGYMLKDTVYTAEVVADKITTINGGAITNEKIEGTLTVKKQVMGGDPAEAFAFEILLNSANAAGSYKATLNGGSADNVVFVKTDAGAKATVALKGGDTLVILGIDAGVGYTVTEQANSRFDVSANGVATNAVTGTIGQNGGSIADFRNTFKQTDFKVNKVWQGAEGGEIELILFANGAMLDPQPEVVRKGNTYTYKGLPTVDAKGNEIVYMVKETTMAGYATQYQNAAPYAEQVNGAYNGGTIINQELTSFMVRKEWLGLEAGDVKPAIRLMLYCNGKLWSDATPTPNAEGWYVYSSLPLLVDGEKAVYTAVELPMDGFMTTYTNTGAKADQTDFAYNGATIVNSKIPQTGDDAPLALWSVLALLALGGLTAMLLNNRRRAAR